MKSITKPELKTEGPDNTAAESFADMVERIGAEFVAVEICDSPTPTNPPSETPITSPANMSPQEIYDWIFCSACPKLSERDCEFVKRAIQSDVDVPVLTWIGLGVFSRSQFFKDKKAGLVNSKKVARMNRLRPREVVAYLKRLRDSLPGG